LLVEFFLVSLCSVVEAALGAFWAAVLVPEIFCWSWFFSSTDVHCKVTRTALVHCKLEAKNISLVELFLIERRTTFPSNLELK